MQFTDSQPKYMCRLLANYACNVSESLSFKKMISSISYPILCVLFVILMFYLKSKMGKLFLFFMNSHTKK